MFTGSFSIGVSFDTSIDRYDGRLGTESAAIARTNGSSSSSALYSASNATAWPGNRPRYAAAFARGSGPSEGSRRIAARSPMAAVSLRFPPANASARRISLARLLDDGPYHAVILAAAHSGVRSLWHMLQALGI